MVLPTTQEKREEMDAMRKVSPEQVEETAEEVK